MKRFTPLIVAFLALVNVAVAQQTTEALTQNYILEKAVEWQLSEDDIAELVVTDNYVTKHSGTRHVYLTQHHNGIPIYNAIQSLAIGKNGKVYSVGDTRFVSQIQNKINRTKPSISAEDAIGKLYQNVANKAVSSAPTKLHTEGSTSFYAPTGIAKRDISARLVYQKMADGTLRLAYQVLLDPLNTDDTWNARIDAENGEIIGKDNHTVYCKFEKDAFHKHSGNCEFKLAVKKENTAAQSSASMMGGTYNVIPFPYESPAHAPFELVSDPADPVASPFGWHDIDGIDGAEFTITRGNNVHAFADHDDAGVSSGDEPDGGAELVFDFPSDFDNDPTTYQAGATTNLFYWMNIMHDFTTVYGFDEAAGNFQQTNYSGEGLGGDYIRANAQDGYQLDPPNVNNANYSGGADGSFPQVQMYVWDGNSGGGTKYLTVVEPSSVGGGYGATAADFGPAIPIDPIEGEVVEVNDGIYNPFISDGCETVTNAAELQGKIALVDRGGCFFQQKALTAEEAGAIAVIICNFEDDPVGMAGVAALAQPTIPTIMIGGIDCSTIRGFAGSSLTVQIGAPTDSGPEFLDGDFDNGIIAHEFGHGVSIRLTGGASTAGCLGNAEQMGEGWSDFFALVTSVQDGDQGGDRRGVGTFVQRLDNDGRGIRRFPYSTDMSISPLTYGDVASNTGVHAVGEVWNTALWDLYWALVEVYGFDEDLMNGDKGNNLAVRLVIDGMKLQGCQPGFVDGRDGILMADELLTGGANRCLIWEVFARRGVGFYASQGASTSASDQIEDFETFPLCIEELKIAKTVTPVVNAGDVIDVVVDVVNHKPETLTGISVSETLPAGLSFVAGSGSIAPTINGDIITFAIGDMTFQQEFTITYQLQTDPDSYSKQLNIETVEDGGTMWSPLAIEGTNIWQATSNSFDGNFAYEVASPATASQQIAIMNEEILIEGDNPVIRIYQSYNTEAGQDAGVFQVTDDFGSGFWSNLDEEDIFRGGFNGTIDYGTFTIPNFNGWYGNSSGYLGTYIDMNDWKGKRLARRFNFGSSDENAAGVPANGFWAIDNVELMDMINYNPDVCIDYDGGTTTCTAAKGRGTIIESQVLSGTRQVQDAGLTFGVFPNPTSDQLNISIIGEETKEAQLSLMTIDGRMVKTQSLLATPVRQLVTISVSDVPAGFYIVRISNKDGAVNKKVIIN